MSWLSQLLHKEWFLGLLSGVGATLIGFVFTIFWDIWKMRTESAERAKSILETLSEEMAVNQINIERNLAALEQELSVLGQGQSIVNALRPIKTGFWEIAKSNTPSKVFPVEQLARLRDLGVLAEEVNEQIRSRENYRIHNGAMNNFSGTMKLYDDILVAALRNFEGAISAYESGERARNRTSPNSGAT